MSADAEARLAAIRAADDALTRHDREVDEARRAHQEALAKLRDRRRDLVSAKDEAVAAAIGKTTGSLFPPAETVPLPAAPVSVAGTVLEATLGPAAPGVLGDPSDPSDPVPSGHEVPDAVRAKSLAPIVLSVSVLARLKKHGEIATVGELWDWVEEDGRDDGGMADPNGVGLFGRLRSVGVSAKLATEAGDRVYGFLKARGCDPRASRKQAPRVEAPTPAAPAEPPPSGWQAVPVEEALDALPLVCDAIERQGVRTLGELDAALRRDETFGLGPTILADLRDEVGMAAAHEGGPEGAPGTGVRRCRVCGCTDDDCSGCIERTGGPCSWAEAELCSACVPEEEQEPAGVRVRDLDELLKLSLLHHIDGSVKMWKQLATKGATAAQIRDAINSVWTSGGQAGPGYEARFKGGAAPVWTGRVDGTPEKTLKGAFLIDQVRRVLDIPMPGARPKPAKPAPKYYGWEVVYKRHGDLTHHRCHYVGTEATARRKAMLRPRAEAVVSAEGLTEEQYVRAYGRGKM